MRSGMAQQKLAYDILIGARLRRRGTYAAPCGKEREREQEREREREGEREGERERGRERGREGERESDRVAWKGGESAFARKVDAQ